GLRCNFRRHNNYQRHPSDLREIVHKNIFQGLEDDSQTPIHLTSCSQKKTGEPSFRLPGKSVKSYSTVRLELQPNRQLHRAAAILERIYIRLRLAHVGVATRNEEIRVVEDVVRLTAQLQLHVFANGERLFGCNADIPVSRTAERVPRVHACWERSKFRSSGCRIERSSVVKQLARP